MSMPRPIWTLVMNAAATGAMSWATNLSSLPMWRINIFFLMLMVVMIGCMIQGQFKGENRRDRP